MTTAVTSIVWARANAPLRTGTGPPTSPGVPDTVPRCAPFIVIAAGLALRKPNAEGSTAVSLLPSGWVTSNRPLRPNLI
jgi:hypothetical protein